jgi:hypothetical protein
MLLSLFMLLHPTYAAPLGMLLSLRILFPSGHAAAPWACCSPCGRSPIRPISFKVVIFARHHFNFQKRVKVWRGGMLLPLGMLLSLGMLFTSGHAAAPWACCSSCGRPPVRQICFKAVTFAYNHFNFQKKLTVWGGKISSQNSIGRLLISSPPSKKTLKQKKFIFLVFSFYSGF